MKAKGRILHLINGEFYSGAERVQDLLAKQLPLYGYEVFFACVKPGIFKDYCQSRSDRVFSFHMRSKYDLSQIIKIARFAKEKGCCLIHSHTPRTALVASLVSLLTKIPMIHHVHSPTAECTENRWRNFINPLVERLALCRSKKNIVVSESLKRYLVAEKIREDLIAVISNGVPTPSELLMREPPAKTYVIGTVALFRPRKGLEVLLHALATIKKHGHAFSFRAIGGFESAQYERRLKDLVEELGLHCEVEWVGFKKNIDFELRGLDLFVLPSLFGEGTPMVILEAMAVGVPVVATMVEGVPDVIRHCREGLLVPPDDEDALVTVVERVICGKEDWVGIRERAFNRQVECYSDVRMAEDVAKIYDEILIK